MTKKQIAAIAIVLALTVSIMLVSIYVIKPQSTPPPKPLISAPLNDPAPGIYSCAQCVGGQNCAQATCNLSCEYFSNGCMTLVSGFMFSEIDTQGKPTAEPLFSGVPGVPLRLVRSDLAALGAQPGDILTHINNEYIGGDLNRLAELSANLSKGDVLTLWTKDGQRKDIKL